MNITQREFDSLKQLDRIEFRQKEDRLRNIKTNYFSFILKGWVITFIGGAFFIGLIAGEPGLAKFLDFFSNLDYAILLTLALGFSLDIIIRIHKLKLIKKLFENYFKVEVKNAKRRK